MQILKNILSNFYIKSFIYLLLFISLIPKSFSSPIQYSTNFSQCFTIINETTIETNSFYYSNSSIKEKCTKLALSEKYKEDIYYPKYFHKCFPLCNSCSGFSKEKNNMKCISCFKGFILDKEKGNCYINKNYSSTKRNQELHKIFNTLNINQKINSKYIKKKYIEGMEYPLTYPKKASHSLRKLYVTDDYDDVYNSIIEREDQSLLSTDMNEISYNFRIELSPYYYLAKRCLEKGKPFIENGRCADECTPHLEYYHGYPEIKITIEVDSNIVTVCDCEFRCCRKKMNELYKSLDRGFIDGSYNYFRNQKNGRCLSYDTPYTERSRNNAYLLAQDFVPCFFPIYDDDGNIEFVISGYQKTIIGNNCINQCPIDNDTQYYYYNPENAGCYKCPENCLECNDIPTAENGHCIKCEKFYYGILNGFCYVLCPEGYGEKNGIKYFCEKCDDDEIVYDNKCVKYQGPTYNYGTAANPSYPDANDNKKIHGCLEYIAYKKYILHLENSACPYVECPDYFINFEGEQECQFCGTGCIKCRLDDRNIACDECDENHQLSLTSCSKCTYTDSNDLCLDNCIGYILGTKCADSCGDEYYSDTHECIEKCVGDDWSMIDEHVMCLGDCNLDYPENINGKCISCPLHGYYNSNGTCVRNVSNFDELYFVLTGEENEKHGKVGSCYIVDELGDLHPEHYYSRSLDPTKCPDDCPSNYNKIVDEYGNITCRKCYETCKSCKYTGSAGNHKCLECIEGYEPSQRMYQVCDQICTGNQYFWFEDTREKKCGDECPSHKPYHVYYENEDEIIHKECLGNCTDNGQFNLEGSFYCITQCPDDYVFDYGTCVEHCKEGYGPLGPKKQCQKCEDKDLLFYEYKCYNLSEETPLGKYFSNDEGILKDCFDYSFSTPQGFKSGYYEQYSNCPLACPEGYHYNYGFCQPCEYDGFSCIYCDHLEGCMDYCPYYSYFSEEDFGIVCTKKCPEELPYIKSGTCVTDCSSEDKIIIYDDDAKECNEINCKDIDTYYDSELNTCNQENKLPEETYFDEENQPNDYENTLSPCLQDISENEQKTGYYAIISNCKSPCNINYYYTKNKTCRKCHSLCEMCFDEGTDEENNCFSCADKENRILNPYLYNCELKCSGSFHYDEITKKIVCDDKCEKGKYIDESSGNCVTTCNKLIEDNYCVDECSEGKIELSGYCLNNDINIPVIVQTIITTIRVEVDKNNDNNNNFKSDITENINNKINTEIIDNNAKTEITNNNYNTNIINNNDNTNIINNNDNTNIINNNVNTEVINNNGNIEATNNNENIAIIDNKSNTEIIDNKSIKEITDRTNINDEQNGNDHENEDNNNNNDNDNNNIYNFDNKNILEIIRLIERNITQYIYSNTDTYNNTENGQFINNDGNHFYKTITTREGNISLIEIFINDTQINLQNSPTIFYFTEIIQQKLKELYPSETSYYFIQIDLNETEKNNINFLPQTKYKIFLKSGEEINITEFNSNMYIILEKEFNFYKKLKNNPQLALSLVQKGINIFDINDPFFQDICYKYQDENGNDVILKNRKEDYYQDVITCISGCEFIGMNSTNYNIQCKCNIDALLLSEDNLYDYLNINYTMDNNYDNNKDTIFDVIKCYKESFNKKNIIKNKGLWIYAGFLVGLLLFYLCLLCYNFDPLYSFLFHFTKKEKIKQGEIIEEEIITKKEVINNYKTKKKELFSENKENPPKKVINNKDSENSKEINFASNINIEPQPQKKKTTYRINFEKNEKEYPKLNISNFGKEGYKLSNNFDKLDLNNLETIVNQESQESNYNMSSPRSHLSNNSSNACPNSPSSESSFYDKKKFIGREVDLEPEGALLESNNFFDTCRIVKLPKNYNNNIKIQNKSSNILTLNNNNYLRRNNNNFYKNKKKTVKLPGFPRPQIEEENEYENENPINRKKNKLNDIIENESSLSDKSENIRNEIYNEEFTEKESEINNKNMDMYHNYKKNLSKKLRYPHRNSTSSLKNSAFTSEIYTQQPITINKYYITNNTSEDNKDKLKNNFVTNNEKNGEKITTIKKRKFIKNYKNIFSDYLYKYDIDITDFEYFITYEKRNFCEIYFSFLSNFQIFLSICLNKNIFVPFNIRGGIALFTVELYFTGIAIFTTFSKLENRYKFNKAVDIIYLIKNEYDVILYTSLLSKIMNLITLFFLTHYSITNVIKEYAFKENIFLQKIQKEIFWLKCKYHIFFIICFILTILQGYYISCFCGIFEGAIIPWIFSSLITLGLNFIASFFIILFSTIFRKMALCCQSYIIFLISKLIILLA